MELNTPQENNFKKKNIGIILATMQGGGAERIATHLLNNLSRQKYRLTLILLKDTGEYRQFISPDVTIHTLSAEIDNTSFIHHIVNIKKIAKALKVIKPDCLISIGFYTNILSVPARYVAGLQKTILIIRETNVLKARLHKKSKKILKILSFFILYRFADIFIAPSQAIIDDFRKLIKKSKLRYFIFPNFIDDIFIEKSINGPHLTSSRIDFVKRGPIIISIGRLVEQKGYEDGLQVFKKTYEKVSCEYWILGQGPLLDKLQNMAQNMQIQNYVKFLGFQKNPYLYLKQASIFFMPSHYEGFPNSLLEAMYLGLPCVVTRFNNSIDQIITHGENGFIVEKRGHISSMSNFLIQLLTDSGLYQHMQKQSKEKGGKYTTRSVIPLLETIIDSNLK